MYTQLTEPIVVYTLNPNRALRSMQFSAHVDGRYVATSSSRTNSTSASDKRSAYHRNSGNF